MNPQKGISVGGWFPQTQASGEHLSDLIKSEETGGIWEGNAYLTGRKDMRPGLN